MNAIVTTAPTWLAYAEMERLAVAIAKSGLFGIKTPEQAIVLMQIAQAEGRHPALAARDYDIIQGRPAKKAEAMHRDFLAGGGKVEWTTLTDDTADATFSHPQGGTARIIWDTDRAALAGLEKKENWKKYPRQMLRNRVVSEGVRTVWPLATSGMHLPEELGDAAKPANDAEFTGTTLDAEEEPPVAPIRDERSQINKSVPLKPVPNPAPRQPHPQMPKGPVDPDIYDQHNIAIELLNVGDSRTWMSNLEMLLAEATSLTAVEVIGECESVKRTIEKAPGSVRARVSELLAKACGRFIENDPDHSAEELPEVEIVGSDKVAAG